MVTADHVRWGFVGPSDPKRSGFTRAVKRHAEEIWERLAPRADGLHWSNERNDDISPSGAMPLLSWASEANPRVSRHVTASRHRSFLTGPDLRARMLDDLGRLAALASVTWGHQEPARAPAARRTADRGVDVFISYKRDHPIAGTPAIEALAEDLRDAGFTVFLDVDSLRAGRWRGQIEHALTNARVFALVVTRTAVFESDEVRREIETAADHLIDVVPIIVEHDAAVAAVLAGVSQFQQLRLDDRAEPLDIEGRQRVVSEITSLLRPDDEPS